MNKIALISGASQGIGKAAALALAKQGVTLCLNARRPDQLQHVLEEVRQIVPGDHSLFIGDLTEPHLREQCFDQIEQRYGRLDILVNNIPGGVPDTFDSFDTEQAVSIFTGKTVTYVHCMQRAVTLMKQNQWGRIVNVVGNFWKEPGATMFTNGMMNAAIVNASKNISIQLAAAQITVNCLNPGTIVTDRYEQYINNLQKNKQISKAEAIQSVNASIPAQRPGTAQEAASLIAYLCSEDAGYVTGQQISVDGGALRSL
ncbi:SDR family oxidoreductase [Paenibacillus campi]|uniref:SDR family oxidoreductase n=1 Tax=Paenibacillus campi TaxID=3106031 RepID=UPI002B002255|nr:MULTISPECIES: SDR family oxidoreductase [unclassified Paenibacillus]